MQANSDVIKGNVREFPLAWEDTRCWAERAFSREQLGSVGIAVGGFAIFLGLVGLVEYAMYQAIQNGSVSGVGASVFGFF